MSKAIDEYFSRKGEGVSIPEVTVSENAFNKQIAGNHYSSLAIQPMQYSLANNLNYGQANAIKYVTRYKAKNGLEDLKKAIHCLELLIAFEYPEEK
jgi:hypothetical protein